MRRRRTRSRTSNNNNGNRGGRRRRGGSRTKATALWGLHKELKAKLVPFAGFDMPVQYANGIIAEHVHTRKAAGLFDVSHMGQCFIEINEGGHEEVAGLVEKVIPGEIKGLKPGQVRYTLLLNEEGGIIDDLMVTRPEGEENEGMLFLVVNAARKKNDFGYLKKILGDQGELTPANDRALIALQGPKAAEVLSRLAPFVAEMGFMTAKACRIEGMECIVTRCGYTGEDGFEISLPNEAAESFARILLEFDEVEPIGLGARDTLRLEAGLCLYGHDITEKNTPADADLIWAIGKRRREEKNFPGAEKIMEAAETPAGRKRVGIKVDGRAPAREGAVIVNEEDEEIGVLTSGGVGPWVGHPVAMGYVDVAHAAVGTSLGVKVRTRKLDAEVVDLPFLPAQYFRPGQELSPREVPEHVTELEKAAAEKAARKAEEEAAKAAAEEEEARRAAEEAAAEAEAEVAEDGGGEAVTDEVEPDTEENSEEKEENEEATGDASVDPDDGDETVAVEESETVSSEKEETELVEANGEKE